MDNTYKNLIQSMSYSMIHDAICYYIFKTELIWSEIPVAERIRLISEYVEEHK